MAERFFDDQDVRVSFLGKKALDVAQLIAAQAKPVYEAEGLEIPVAASSTLLILGRRATLSQSEIATALNQPHQTVAQHIRALEKRRLVHNRRAPGDARARAYSLTPKGKDQYRRLERYLQVVHAVFQQLFEEIDADLADALEKAETALGAVTLKQRFDRMEAASHAA